MDMGIIMRSKSGAVCTLSLSFNNDGPIGSPYRYICDNGTYLAMYDDLTDGHNKPVDLSKVDVSMNGFEIEDREFIAAIKEGRQPNSSVENALTTMQVLDKLATQLKANTGYN
jgi:2-hydroxy-4-carboxymuconate semialdehyde hemiacetal dehydrogenase